MTRGGARVEREEPERRCLVTGETGPRSGLVRFVVGPEGQVVPDVAGKLPGRGMYVTASRPILEQARKGQFARAAKAPVTVPDNLAEEVERQLAHRVVDLISLARKGGLAIAGFEKVKEALALAVMLVVFLPCRAHFYRRAALFSQGFTPGWIGTVVILVSASMWLGYFSYKHMEYSTSMWWQFSEAGDASRFLRAGAGVVCAVFLFAIARLLRPAAPDLPLGHIYGITTFELG